MAEEVKIVDVAGGPAAEATLQEILKIMKSGGGGSGGAGAASDKAAAKAQDLYTTAVTRGTTARKENTGAVKDATESTKTFGDRLSRVGGMIGNVFGGIAGVTKNLTQAFASATTIGGVLEAVPVFGTVLSSATGYFQTSVDTFRQLSEVGAGFGNDMMAIRNAAAESGLSIEQFASVIGNNAQSMRLLGTTTSEGAARFGRLSKALRTQEAGLLSLGFTQEQVNEGLADYIESQALAGQVRGRSDASLIAGAQNYLKELDQLSRVTGRSRKELQDEINQRNQAANINVLAARLSGDALNNFNNNMSFTSAMMGEDFTNAMADMADGVSQSRFAQVLEANVPGLAELQRQNATGAITQEEYQARLMALLPRITEFADNMGAAGVTALMGAEGTGEFVNSVARARVAGETYANMQEEGAAAEAARQEQLRRAPLTETFANFEQTIQNVRSAFENALIDSGILETVGGLLGDMGTALTDVANDLTFAFSEYLASPAFQSDMAAFQEWIQKTKDKLSAFFDSIGEKGLLETIKDMFGSEGEDSSFGSMISDWIFDAIGSMLPSADTLLLGLAAGIATLIFAPFLGAFGAIGVAIAAMFGWDTIKGWAEDAWNGITGMFSGITEWWNGLDFMAPLRAALDSVTGVFSSVGEWFSASRIRERLVEAWDSVTGVFNGIKDWWNNISFVEMISNAWNSVTGVFSGIGEWWNNFDFGTWIDNVLVTIWDSAAAAFGAIGEWFSNFSLTETLTNMWNTVTGWFSFDGIELPSISDMFSGIIDTVRSFFDFDFEMPSISSFLPSWLGGDSDEPGTTATAAVSTQAPAAGTTIDLSQPDNVTALASMDFAAQTASARELQAVLADIGAMQSFNNELERIQAGLDSDRVNSYNEAMERLVDTLEDLNEVLSEDNRGMFGGGTGVAAANVIGGMNSGGSSNDRSGEQLERLNTLVSQLISLTEEGNRYSRNTVRAIGGNLQA